MKTLLQMSTWLMLAAALASCGGGSSTADNQPTQFTPDPVSNLPTTATVAIVLTDYAVDDYDQALATISSIELLGADDGKQTVFEGMETVDLLALRDEQKLFAVNENITPGDFTKIRMHADSLVLVKDLGDGMKEEIEAKLVGNGKIDLNPRETITLNAGDVVFVSLDWDMKESLKLTEAGPDKKKLIMRPVIFVDIGAEPAFKQGLVRVNGNIALIAEDFSYFRLCETEMPVQLPKIPEIGDLCLDILVDEVKTGLFDATGEPVTVSQLTVGEPVSVVGVLRRSADGPVLAPLQDDNGGVKPTMFQVAAIVVEAGDTWDQYRGTIQEPVDDMGMFPFLLDAAEEGMEGQVATGQLAATTRIFKISLLDGVEEILPAQLMTDDRAMVDAVKLSADVDTDPDVLRIALMLARTPPDADDSIVGEILSINTVDRTLQLLTGSMELCVSTTDDTTRIFEVVVDPTGISTSEITLDELDIGSKALVGGMQDNGCYAAELIIAEARASMP